MTPNSARLFQLFKYSVYAFLAFNVYLFWREEFPAASLQFGDSIALSDLIEAYVATIDTAAWVVLLLMFELETYVLDDRHFTPRVVWSLHGLRALCYTFILYSVYGYIANLMFVTDVQILSGIAEICSLLPGSWSWAVTLDQYEAITASNCAGLSDAGTYYSFNGMSAIVDAAGLGEIQRLAWADVINGITWVLVVVVLEIDVRLQEHGLLRGAALRTSQASKFVLYSILLLAAIYWTFEGGFVDSWDAWLWLVAFVFIELNVFEWRHEEQGPATAPRGAVISE
ncbi:MAG TPA: hypothetical protein VIS31_02805 [Woeseiaceae bacterium]